MSFIEISNDEGNESKANIFYDSNIFSLLDDSLKKNKNLNNQLESSQQRLDDEDFNKAYDFEIFSNNTHITKFDDGLKKNNNFIDINDDDKFNSKNKDNKQYQNYLEIDKNLEKLKADSNINNSVLGNNCYYENEYYLENSDQVDNIISGYKTYSLCYRDSKTKINEILSKDRRYTNFFNFRKILKYYFPSIIIPVLPHKDLINSKFQNDESFNTSRYKKLNHFFKTVGNIDQINKSCIFKTFISEQKLKDSAFEENYFSPNNIYNDFTETEESLLIKHSVLNKDFFITSKEASINSILLSVTSIFASKQKNLRLITENEKKVNDYEKSFNNIRNNFSEFLQNSLNLLKTKLYEENELFLPLSNNFLYLKTYKYKDSKFSKNLDDLHIKYLNYKEKGKGLASKIESVIEKLENIESDFNGVKELFDHYLNIININELVLNSVLKMKNQNKQSNLDKIKGEKIKIENIKINFENSVCNSVSNFISKFMEDFPDLLNKINLIEKEFIEISSKD